MISFISFIVPAHNEAFEIGAALESVFRSARAVGCPFEVIVANDASTDQTADIARGTGARVIDVSLRKISAVRNAGAKVSTGDLLFFIDADTHLQEATLRAAIRAVERGAAGGGASISFSDHVGRFNQIAIQLFSYVYGRILGWAAGCFIFARRDAFESAGGFDETLYACEEVALSLALKRQGPFTVLRETVLTSGRKLRMYSPFLIIPLTLRFLRYGPAIFRERRGLEWWYEGKRESRSPPQL